MNLVMLKLCQLAKLGILIDEPRPVFGGLLHKMYKIKTNKGTYAVKALRPQIMKREIALSHCILSSC